MRYPHKGFKRDKDQKRCHGVMNNLSYDSFGGCYLEINSSGLVHGRKQRSRESMNGILIQEI